MFRFTSDGLRVVYGATQLTSGKVELFSVPLASPGQWRKESGPMVADGDLVGFAVAPAAHDLIYWADADLDGATELDRKVNPLGPKRRAAEAPEETVER
jgi:hypothetical protein